MKVKTYILWVARHLYDSIWDLQVCSIVKTNEHSHDVDELLDVLSNFIKIIVDVAKIILTSE
jgi:hypothetical protein